MSSLASVPLQAGEGASVVGAVFVFLVNLLIGALGIHFGAKLVVDADVGFRRAIVAALVGALIWTVVAFFFGWIPLLGPILTLLAWIAVINWSYPGGWGSAIAIAFVAWLVALVVLWALATVGIFEFAALGIPDA